ncbi:MAG: UDP-N-acetylglucosamine--N-acetylmuramyl-(pentapeptide) pyrophosphoryl-undecaprenol N-acetylglucosamine transferase [Acidimicrobiia bacterium]
MSATFAIITGGGTGGHVYPALALADELVARGHPRESIRFVGAQRGLEVTAVPGAGYAIDVLPGRGLDRARTLDALRRNFRTTWDTLVAFVHAGGIVRRTRPAVVVGVGGYASLPALVAGRLHRIPAVVHEADAHPGLANRVAVRLGARPAVSLPGTPLRGAVVTGNPIRPEIVRVQRAPVAPPVVAVVGGSLGAQRINLATLALYDLWRMRNDVVIHHVTGARGYEECRERLTRLRARGDTLDYRLIRYEDHMEMLYANATVLVCRSGGMTAELAAVGMPSILVPLPGAPGDHQTRNAEVFARAGAGVMVPDSELDGARLRSELEAMLADPPRLRAMGEAARALGRTDATARFADLVEEVARGR